MEKQAIQSLRAPKAVGSYSQAVRAGGFVFVSGQIALDSAAGAIVGGDVTSQMKQVFLNLKNILEDAGLSLDNVVKTTLYLKNMADFSMANDVYGSCFKPPYPARSTVEVSRLPKDVLVELDAIAHCDDRRP